MCDRDGGKEGAVDSRDRLFVTVGSFLLTLVIAVSGALLATVLKIPLPWMLGPLIATAIPSIAGLKVGRLSLRVPDQIRSFSIPLLGTMIASKVNPDVIAGVVSWWPSLLSIVPYVILLQLTNFMVFRTFGHYDRATAYFAASPGGLMEATLLGGEHGGSASRIVLQHSARVTLAVLTVPVLMSIMEFSYTRPAPANLLTFNYTMADLPQLGLLIGCALVGVYVARRLRLPAPLMIGPFFLAGTLYGTGFVDLTVPTLLIDIALLSIGASLGTRFGPGDRALLISSAGMSILALFSSYGLALLAALALSALGVASFPLIFLSFSPGGMTEMSMIAVALEIDPVFVATHHLARIVSAVTFSTLIFKYIIKREPWRRT